MSEIVQIMLSMEKEVSEDNKRLYYRFRVDKWYNGIITADCYGCGLGCTFCWANRFNRKIAMFLTPSDVVEKLPRTPSIMQVRLSGGEPTLNMQHLTELLWELAKQRWVRLFILETNGILLAAEPERIEMLKPFRSFIHVRVGVKGASPKEFATYTGKNPEGWNLQMKAYSMLERYKFRSHIAVMTSETTVPFAHEIERVIEYRR